jgi:hypothetical protein
MLYNILPSGLNPYIWMKLLGIIGVGFDIKDHLLIRYFCISQILEKEWEYHEMLHQLLTYIKKVRREVLYNIMMEFGIPMKLVRMIKVCSNEAYNKVCIGKHLSDDFLTLKKTRN